jgi:hypothetical protein
MASLANLVDYTLIWYPNANGGQGALGVNPMVIPSGTLLGGTAIDVEQDAPNVVVSVDTNALANDTAFVDALVGNSAFVDGLSAVLAETLAGNEAFVAAVSAAIAAQIYEQTSKPSTAGTLWNSGLVVEISDGNP